MIFGYLFHSLIGVVINYAEQLGYNDKTQYILGIGFIPIFNLVALFILVFIWLRSKRKNIMVAKAI
jgi:uncharacterized membrane protein YeiB